jgi:iron complex transport system substrate-binding protein
VLQRKSCTRLLAALLLLATLCSAVFPPGTVAAAGPTTTPAARIVSLSPAATDLLLALGAGDRLVGVSTFDTDEQVASLPHVGDYENVDWEQIATLTPGHMIVQMAPDRLPAGFKERADKLGVALYNAHIDRLADVMREARGLGEAIGLQAGATKFLETINAQLETAHRRLAEKPRVRTLICTSDDGLGVAGRDTYLDDLLTIAGGENVLGEGQRGYIKLDREALLALAPDAIIQLSPSPTMAQRQLTAQAWSQLDALPAIKNKRVLTLNEPWALTPGSHVGTLAQRMAEFLHP